MRPVLLTMLGAMAGLAAPNGSIAIPGDTAEDPLPIPSLPFMDSGTTCVYTNQYDELCPYTGGYSPDVVYAYQPPTDFTVNVSLCESDYDTKILVYENLADSSHLYACNDDGCSGPNYPWPYLAHLQDLPLAAGNTYYFVVDGYSLPCGSYVLHIVESVSCELTCPPGAAEEGEVKCVNGAADTTNAGCALDPPRFEPIPGFPGPAAVCGFTNAPGGYQHEDHDWYEIAPSTADSMSITIVADIAMFVTILDGTTGCVDPPGLGNLLTEPCDTAAVVVAMPAGPVWIDVRPLLHGGVGCPSEYVLSVEGRGGVVSARPAETPPVFVRLDVVPNPFRVSASIRGGAPARGTVNVRIHDVRGRLVRILHEGPLPSGAPVLEWDGSDVRGRAAPAGVYFCRWRDASGVRTARLVRLTR